MFNQERNSQKKVKIRIIIMILTILISKNLEIEIVRPNLTVKISIESIYIQSVDKLLKWF
ncbi:hypothetical protein FDUTEX481_05248 [Tolypothrix sp. PCC 7601]|nr:hypothetical protein FDUTEX481_05248 [Tolypothrix sp. PCC 7601]BAY95703.1 hypothetical protein NIES3275_77800 [Microchaete diplosiphon NIES-3275]